MAEARFRWEDRARLPASRRRRPMKPNPGAPGGPTQVRRGARHAGMRAAYGDTTRGSAARGVQCLPASKRAWLARVGATAFGLCRLTLAAMENNAQTRAASEQVASVINR